MAVKAENKDTTLALFDRLKNEIVQNGRVNKLMLRAAFGNAITDRVFGMAWWRAKRELEDEGIFLVPVHKQTGMYRIASSEDVVRKAMYDSRLKVVKQLDRREELIVNAQKHKDLSEEDRQRLNTEEIVYSRFVQAAHRELLRRERKRPSGL